MSKDNPATQTFADHEVITPANKLRKAVSSVPLAPGDDPVARAERALEDLSSEFAGWMQTECERLDQARSEVKRQGFTKTTKDALFHAAHDIKGEADTFGYPGVTGAAESLCRLLEHAPDATRIPLQLIDQHVDAVRAIYREYERSDAAELAFSLSRRLREVTDEFLIHVNRHRPDVLELIQGPPLAPDQIG
ncbi:MAG: Hpt domain-containing protein [Rhizobiales bacterium]|nr:Hpt domain-containing protein [Hyphomicrobiales bacterium]MCW5686656.1 Hpt domain-containing protein [Pseudolabrys sp.]OJY43852.1 MAG: histidine kinase [Rhizobiales bacterium 64-17]